MKNSTPAIPFKGHSTVLHSTRFKSYRPKKDLNYGVSNTNNGGDDSSKNDNVSDDKYDDKHDDHDNVCVMGNDGGRRNDSETVNNLASAMLPSSSSSSSYAPSFSLPVTVPKKRRVVGVSDIHGKSITTSTSNNNNINNNNNDQDDNHINNNENDIGDNNNNSNGNYNILHNNNNSTVLPIRSYVYNGRGDNAESIHTLNHNIEIDEEVEKEVEKEEVDDEECRLLDSDFHLIVMTHAEVNIHIVLSFCLLIFFSHHPLIFFLSSSIVLRSTILIMSFCTPHFIYLSTYLLSIYLSFCLSVTLPFFPSFFLSYCHSANLPHLLTPPILFIAFLLCSISDILASLTFKEIAMLAFSASGFKFLISVFLQIRI